MELWLSREDKSELYIILDKCQGAPFDIQNIADVKQ